LTKKLNPSPSPSPNPNVGNDRYAVGKNQSLSQKMARIRGRVQASGQYVHKMHPDAPRVSQVKGYLSPISRKRMVHARFDSDNPSRRSFTVYEIEIMYLALVKVMAYYGGNRALAVRETGFSSATLGNWIKTGRMTPMGADVIGSNVNIPFDKYELRPDLSVEAWKRFDATKDKAYARRVRLRYQESHRIEL
jgi:hypothetical protein